MPITLTFGSNNSNDIKVSSLTDLITSQTAPPTMLRLADPVIPGLNQPVARFPAASSPVKLSYQSGNNCWTVGNYSFGLSGEVDGEVAVIAPGQKLIDSYTKTFSTTVGTDLDAQTNSKNTGSIVAPPPRYYLSVQLALTLAANGSAKVNIGEVGVQGSASATNTFKVRFYKKVDPAALLKDALAQAFAGFVLPLHSQTFQHLEVGDYLYHQFNATLNLGFGVTLGLNQVLFSGQYKAAIPDAPAGTPSVKMCAKVGLQANACFGITFKSSGSFEAMMWKTGENAAHLHLYRSTTTDPEFTIGATLSVGADPAAKLTAANLSDLAGAVFPNGTGNAVSSLIAQKGQSEITKWSCDVQSRITSWLKPFQESKASLQIAIDNLNSKFLLIDATCDTSQLGFAPAWQRLLAGDFQAALSQNNCGITLDPGSGLEDFHHQKTDITLNLFSRCKGEWQTGNITNYSILYAGNNTFNLVENTGLENLTNVDGSGREVEIFFAAKATEDIAGNMQIAAPDLHYVLKATNNRKFGKSVAQFLASVLSGDQVAVQLHNQFVASVDRGNEVQKVEVIFAPSAYQNLAFSSPGSDLAADTHNFNAFALACWSSEPGVIADATNFSVQNKLDLNYSVWRTWNMIANGIDPNDSSKFPNRRDPGDWDGSDATTFLDQHFLSPAALAAIPFALRAAAGFMNGCEDLSNLATQASANAIPSWNALCADMQYIMAHDLSVDYLAPTISALTGLLLQQGVKGTYTGPTTHAAGEPSINITLRYA